MKLNEEFRSSKEQSSNRSEIDSLLICFSHLRWHFVLQRPQHLMSRIAENARVVFWEEPVENAALQQPSLDLQPSDFPRVTIATPQLPKGLDAQETQKVLGNLLDALLADERGRLVFWYYTPMMLPFSRHREADCVVYDCMDELANFRFAPPELLEMEAELFERADLVFTGGHSLYEAKRDCHDRIQPFPSSVDRAHFERARNAMREPDDQADLPRPRLGFFGVIDERMDMDLLAALADARPDWSIVMVGPVVKIGEDELARRPNIHYLGARDYEVLPDYLGGWDVALMPFAINEATRFISPTKTPEYLAGGVPVVSTPIVDVVRHYGHIAGVSIAGDPDAFVAACEQALAMASQGKAWRDEADELLKTMDWDIVVHRMWSEIEQQLRRSELQRMVVSPSGLSQGQPHYDVLVVGAGFAGSVMAERLATQSGKRVLVVDRRPHIAGNAYDHLDEAGLLIHEYGPHIFHTNSADIFAYLSQFTRWRPYEHRVLAHVDDRLVPIPINRTTLNAVYGLDLQDDAGAAAFLASRAEPLDLISTSEDVVVSAIGRELYEKFFRGYTRKQWGLDPSQLDKSVTARVPTRTNDDDRYFADRFQFMPADGYTAMFERMLDHPNIEVLLDTEYRDARQVYAHDHLVFTGPIDEFFDYRYGRLPYRSLKFEHVTLDQELHQPVAVVNYPDEAVPFTRITEYKHLTGQQHSRTSITREYPCADGDPFYPVPRAENQDMFR